MIRTVVIFPEHLWGTT